MRRSSARPKKKLARPRGGLSSLLADIRGHAAAETVIMIPVLAIIWGGVFYAHQRYVRAIHMSQATRAHVWAHAYEGCEGSPRGDTRISTASSSMDGFVSGAVELLFIADPGMNFEEIEGRRQGTVQRPAVLGEGSVTVSHQYVLMCNQRTSDIDNFALDAWLRFF